MTDLERLRDAERAKRLFVLGAVAIVYGTGWLVFDHRATRIVETVGTVSRIYQNAWYTVDHEYRGVDYSANLTNPRAVMRSSPMSHCPLNFSYPRALRASAWSESSTITLR